MEQMNFSQSLESSSKEKKSTSTKLISKELLEQRKKNGEITEFSKQFPQMFVGADGKFYVKNSFNCDLYSYARYESKDVYDHGKEIHTFDHVSHEDALAQFEKEVCHEFAIKVNDETQVVMCNLVGELLEPIGEITLMRDYLKRLIKENGKENVNFTHEEICIDSSSKLSE